MKENKHLSVLGVGPLYVISILILTIIALILNQLNVVYKIKVLNKFLIILAIISILIAISLWVSAVLFSKVRTKIKENTLVTTGVYSIVRNPIYSAFLFLFTGILLFTRNLYLLIFPVIFWIYLTYLLKETEEKWLKDKFKEEYQKYMKKVNRIIPNIFKK
jgi:hypothetical protein